MSAASSDLSTRTLTSSIIVVSQYTPNGYERTSFYNGITGNGDHPDLVYRSDFLATPFPKPVGRYAHIPVKSLRGVFDTPLNGVCHVDAIGRVIADHGILADIWVREIVQPEAKETKSAEDARSTRRNRRNLDDENEAMADLEALYDEVIKDWSDITLHRNIGHIQYTAAIKVDVEGGTGYASGWAAFLAAEANVKNEFEGNVVDLGAFRSFSHLPRLT